MRSISIILIAAFLLQEVGHAAPELKPIEINIESFSDRKWAQDFLPEFPESVATLESAHRNNRTPEQQVIVLLQDAHTNYSAQKNQAAFLDRLLAKHPDIHHIFTEAASGDVSLSALRGTAPLSHRIQVSEKYLRKGLLHGVEYLDVTSEHPFTIWGVEDAEQYRSSVATYAAITKEREAFDAYAQQIESRLDWLAPRLLNPLLQKFEQNRRSFRAGERALTDHFNYLWQIARGQGVDLSQFKGLLSLQRIQNSERRIDFIKANAELALAVGRLSEDERKQVSLFKVSVHDPEASAGFFATLQERIPAGQYPELDKYFAYLDLVREMDKAAILDEIDAIEAKLSETFLTTQDERSWVSASRATETLRKIFTLTLTPDEYQLYKSDREGHSLEKITGFINDKLVLLSAEPQDILFLKSGFGGIVSACETFYELTFERDRTFVKNMLRKMTDEGQKKAVLITGGYHTPHLKRLLEKEHVSVITVTPQVLHETNIHRYEKILLSQDLQQLASASVAMAKMNMTLFARSPGAPKELRGFTDELSRRTFIQMVAAPVLRAQVPTQKTSDDIRRTLILTAERVRLSSGLTAKQKADIALGLALLQDSTRFSIEVVNDAQERFTVKVQPVLRKLVVNDAYWQQFTPLEKEAALAHEASHLQAKQLSIYEDKDVIWFYNLPVKGRLVPADHTRYKKAYALIVGNELDANEIQKQLFLEGSGLSSAAELKSYFQKLADSKPQGSMLKADYENWAKILDTNGNIDRVEAAMRIALLGPGFQMHQIERLVLGAAVSDSEALAADLKKGIAAGNISFGSLITNPNFRNWAANWLKLAGARLSDRPVEFSARTRAWGWDKLKARTFEGKIHDVLIVGGGAAGAGMARQAALSRLNTVLIEKNDFASGASGNTSKAIHKGIRYLGMAYDALLSGDLISAWHHFKLVVLNARAEAELQKVAPHLVKPVHFYVPIYQNGPRKMWEMRLGLFFYKGLSRIFGGRSTDVAFESKEEVIGRYPGIRQEGLIGAAIFQDSDTDDAKLVRHVIRDAYAHGANTLSHVEFLEVSASRMDGTGQMFYSVRIRDRLSREEISIHTRHIVDATGAWMDSSLLRPSKGAHLEIFDPAFVEPLWQKYQNGNLSPFLIDQKDKIIFMTAKQTPDGTRYFRVGPTDTESADPDRVFATEDDIRIILGLLKKYFPDLSIDLDQVHVDAGIRPLAQDPRAKDIKAVSRSYQIIRTEDGIWHMPGVKLTELLQAGHDMARRLSHLLDQKVANSQGTILNGAHFNEPQLMSDDAKSLRDWIQYKIDHEQLMTFSDLMFRQDGARVLLGQDEVRMAFWVMRDKLRWSDKEQHIQYQTYARERVLRHKALRSVAGARLSSHARILDDKGRTIGESTGRDNLKELTRSFKPGDQFRVQKILNSGQFQFGGRIWFELPKYAGYGIEVHFRMGTEGPELMDVILLTDSQQAPLGLHGSYLDGSAKEYRADGYQTAYHWEMPHEKLLAVPVNHTLLVQKRLSDEGRFRFGGYHRPWFQSRKHEGFTVRVTIGPAKDGHRVAEKVVLSIGPDGHPLNETIDPWVRKMAVSGMNRSILLERLRTLQNRLQNYLIAEIDQAPVLAELADELRRGAEQLAAVPRNGVVDAESVMSIIDRTRSRLDAMRHKGVPSVHDVIDIEPSREERQARKFSPGQVIGVWVALPATKRSEKDAYYKLFEDHGAVFIEVERGRVYRARVRSIHARHDVVHFDYLNSADEPSGLTSSRPVDTDDMGTLKAAHGDFRIDASGGVDLSVPDLGIREVSILTGINYSTFYNRITKNRLTGVRVEKTGKKLAYFIGTDRVKKWVYYLDLLERDHGMPRSIEVLAVIDQEQELDRILGALQDDPGIQKARRTRATKASKAAPIVPTYVPRWNTWSMTPEDVARSKAYLAALVTDIGFDWNKNFEQRPRLQGSGYLGRINNMDRINYMPFEAFQSELSFRPSPIKHLDVFMSEAYMKDGFPHIVFSLSKDGVDVFQKTFVLSKKITYARGINQYVGQQRPILLLANVEKFSPFQAEAAEDMAPLLNASTIDEFDREARSMNGSLKGRRLDPRGKENLVHIFGVVDGKKDFYIPGISGTKGKWKGIVLHSRFNGSYFQFTAAFTNDQGDTKKYLFIVAYELKDRLMVFEVNDDGDPDVPNDGYAVYRDENEFGDPAQVLIPVTKRTPAKELLSKQVRRDAERVAASIKDVHVRRAAEEIISGEDPNVVRLMPGISNEHVEAALRQLRQELSKYTRRAATGARLASDDPSKLQDIKASDIALLYGVSFLMLPLGILLHETGHYIAAKIYQWSHPDHKIAIRFKLYWLSGGVQYDLEDNQWRDFPHAWKFAPVIASGPLMNVGSIIAAAAFFYSSPSLITYFISVSAIVWNAMILRSANKGPKSDIQRLLANLEAYQLYRHAKKNYKELSGRSTTMLYKELVPDGFDGNIVFIEAKDGVRYMLAWRIEGGQPLLTDESVTSDLHPPQQGNEVELKFKTKRLKTVAGQESVRHAGREYALYRISNVRLNKSKTISGNVAKEAISYNTAGARLAGKVSARRYPRWMPGDEGESQDARYQNLIQDIVATGSVEAHQRKLGLKRQLQIYMRNHPALNQQVKAALKEKILRPDWFTGRYGKDRDRAEQKFLKELSDVGSLLKLAPIIGVAYHLLKRVVRQDPDLAERVSSAILPKWVPGTYEDSYEDRMRKLIFTYVKLGSFREMSRELGAKESAIRNFMSWHELLGRAQSLEYMLTDRQRVLLKGSGSVFARLDQLKSAWTQRPEVMTRLSGDIMHRLEVMDIDFVKKPVDKWSPRDVYMASFLLHPFRELFSREEQVTLELFWSKIMHAQSRTALPSDIVREAGPEAAFREWRALDIEYLQEKLTRLPLKRVSLQSLIRHSRSEGQNMLPTVFSSEDMRSMIAELVLQGEPISFVHPGMIEIGTSGARLAQRAASDAKIISAARVLQNEDPLRRISTSDIAKRAGVSISTVSLRMVMNADVKQAVNVAMSLDRRIIGSAVALVDRGEKRITMLKIGALAGAHVNTLTQRKRANKEVRQAIETAISLDQHILRALKRLQAEPGIAVTKTRLVEESGLDLVTINKRMAKNALIRKNVKAAMFATQNDIRILAAIRSLEAKGFKVMTQEMIADETGVDPQTITRSIRRNAVVANQIAKVKAVNRNDVRIMAALDDMRKQTRPITPGSLADASQMDHKAIRARMAADNKVGRAIVEAQAEVRARIEEAKEQYYRYADTMIGISIESLAQEGVMVNSVVLAERSNMPLTFVRVRIKSSAVLRRSIAGANREIRAKYSTTVPGHTRQWDKSVRDRQLVSISREPSPYDRAYSRQLWELVSSKLANYTGKHKKLVRKLHEGESFEDLIAAGLIDVEAADQFKRDIAAIFSSSLPALEAAGARLAEEVHGLQSTVHSMLLATRRSGAVMIGSTKFHIKMRDGKVLIYERRGFLWSKPFVADARVIKASSKSAQPMLEMTQADFLALLKVFSMKVDALDAAHADLKDQQALAVLQVDKFMNDKTWEESLHVLTAQIAKAHKRDPKSAVVLAGSRSAKVYEDMMRLDPKLSTAVYLGEENIPALYQNAPRTVLEALDISSVPTQGEGRRLFVQALPEGAVYNFYDLIRLALIEARMGELTTSNPALVDFMRTWSDLLGEPIKDIEQFMKVLSGQEQNARIILQYAFIPKPLSLHMQVRAYQMMSRQVAQAA